MVNIDRIIDENINRLLFESTRGQINIKIKNTSNTESCTYVWQMNQCYIKGKNFTVRWRNNDVNEKGYPSSIQVSKDAQGNYIVQAGWCYQGEPGKMSIHTSRVNQSDIQRSRNKIVVGLSNSGKEVAISENQFKRYNDFYKRTYDSNGVAQSKDNGQEEERVVYNPSEIPSHNPNPNQTNGEGGDISNNTNPSNEPTSESPSPKETGSTGTNQEDGTSNKPNPSSEEQDKGTTSDAKPNMSNNLSELLWQGSDLLTDMKSDIADVRSVFRRYEVLKKRYFSYFDKEDKVAKEAIADCTKLYQEFHAAEAMMQKGVNLISSYANRIHKAKSLIQDPANNAGRAAQIFMNQKYDAWVNYFSQDEDRFNEFQAGIQNTIQTLKALYELCEKYLSWWLPSFNNYNGPGSYQGYGEKKAEDNKQSATPSANESRKPSKRLIISESKFRKIFSNTIC